MWERRREIVRAHASNEYDEGMWRSIATGLVVAFITALDVRIVAPPHHLYRGRYFFPEPTTLAIVCSVVTGLGTVVFDYRSRRKAIEVTRRKKLGLCLECGYDMRSTPQRCPECGSAPEK
jgi:hypothetical protein